MDGKERRINLCTRTAGCRKLSYSIGQSVTEIHARARCASPAENCPDSRSRFRATVSRHAFCHAFIIRPGGCRRVARARGASNSASVAEPAQSGRGGADPAGHIEIITRMAASPRQNSSRPGTSDQRDIHDERTWRSRDIPTRESNPELRRKVEQSIEELIDLRNGRLVRKHEGQQRKAGCATHRGDVADIDRESLVADVRRSGEAPVEMYSFDERVGGEDLESAAIGRRDRGIVADSDNERFVGGRHATTNSVYQGTLAGVGNAESCRATGRTQRRASP